uniref:hypothetical protein n=1 Tax=Candidatus Electronema sp. TaxID=2698783 RepID=UPI0040579AE3
MRNIFFSLLLLGLFFGGQGKVFAEIKKVSIPDVQVAPSLKSVMSQRDSVLRQSSAAEEAAAAASISTNGQFLTPDGTVIVDSLIEPKCVFYGNYNEGGGDAFQYIDVDTIVFECQ